MPLIIITGYPCSGKTHRASQILDDFQSRILSQTLDSNNKRTITYIPSHHSSLDPLSSEFQSNIPSDSKSNPRDQIYNSSPLEKTARAEEFSAIKRALRKNNIVIADGLNYIKGFRYQLWCEAKAAGTRCVVVHTAARDDEVKEWNDNRLRAWGWEVDEGIDEQDGKKSNSGPKIGRDVLGDLMPEGHTAIYGDRVVEFGDGTRSRSSSMGGVVSDEDEDIQQKRRIAKEDTMTLKSLYISDRSTVDNQTKSNGTSIPTTILESQPTTASSELPSLKASLPYTQTTLKSLTMRYEPPSPFTRWDTPLFTIPTADLHPPYQQIWSAIYPKQTIKPSKKAISQSLPTQKQDEVKPHAATILPNATSSEALQILEQTTGDLIKSLLIASRSSNLAEGEGGTLIFKLVDGFEVEITIPINTTLSQPSLQRLRRKYTQIQRGGIAHGRGYVSGRTEIVNGFVRFLEAEWDG